MSEKQAQAEPITPLDPDRIREISATLDDDPSGSGDPISQRGTWGKLAQLKSFQDVVSVAVETEDEPIPQLTEAIFLHYSQTGKQTAYAEFEGSARPGFAKLVLAECIDNSGRFLDGGGTRIMLTSAPVCSTAERIVLNTGTPRCSPPPRPGVTPPTIWVPYSMHCCVWKVPWLPVMP